MKNYFNIFLVFFVIIINATSQNSVPNDWFFGNPGEGFNGIALKKAYGEFLKEKKTKTVIVAIIDSGIDIQHEDLSENIWVNPGEIPNNGKDDDKNGYIDDVNGWNFIGGPDGRNVGPDSYEATRIFSSLKYKFDIANPGKLNKTQKKNTILSSAPRK
ncbi:MAG: hypothetical protein IPL55_02265 [Saprospiraceae bacterium]|nr:hypothetical protein [Saprospiraceae bacterium]